MEFITIRNIDSIVQILTEEEFWKIIGLLFSSFLSSFLNSQKNISYNIEIINLIIGIYHLKLTLTHKSNKTNSEYIVLPYGYHFNEMILTLKF
jgi:hypothetical protein